jgi:carbon storage regulator
MLVLSRKERERIRLGDSIVLTVVQVSGDRVRIGVEAPEHILILRDELEAYGSEPAVCSEPAGAAAGIATAGIPAASLTATVSPAAGLPVSGAALSGAENGLRSRVARAERE